MIERIARIIDHSDDVEKVTGLILPNLFGWNLGLFKYAMDHCNLFTFEAAAMAIAGDARLDTPERVHALLEGLLEEKRSVYIEYRESDRCSHMSHFFGVAPDKSLPLSEPLAQKGLVLTIEGAGKARVDLLWRHARRRKLPDLRQLTRKMPGQVRKAIEDSLLIQGSLCHADIDLAAVEIKRHSEFKASLLDANLDNAVHKKISEMSKASELRSGIKNVLWWQYYLHQACRIKWDASGLAILSQYAAMTGKNVDVVKANAAYNLVAEMATAAALLTVLDLPPKFVERYAAAGRSASISNGVKARGVKKKLSIVNAAAGPDNELYSPAVSLTLAQDRPSTSTGKKAAWHPVRGHLFRTRYGSIAYRRRHWRGSPVVKGVKRVR